MQVIMQLEKSMMWTSLIKTHHTCLSIWVPRCQVCLATTSTSTQPRVEMAAIHASKQVHLRLPTHVGGMCVHS